MHKAKKLEWSKVAGLVAFLLAGASYYASASEDLTESNNSRPVLSLTIRCTNEVLKAGDEIPIEFIITNRGTNDFKYADRTYDRTGRMPEYSLVAKDESGAVVPTTRGFDGFGGGLFQYAVLRPGQSFNKTIPLNLWALVKKPGRYAVVGAYGGGYSSVLAPVSFDPITVTVLPRSGKELDGYINSLSNQIAVLPAPRDDKGAVVSTPELDGLIRRLTFTCSPKIVPIVLSCMSVPGHGGFWEYVAILNYVPHSDEIRKAVIKAATERGLGPNGAGVLSDYVGNTAEMKPLIERLLAPDNHENWETGARLAQQFGDDAFTSRLIAIATTPGNSARVEAIGALAANRTDEGVKTLKNLLNDPDPKIQSMTEFFIRCAYTSRGIWRGRPLKPGDFEAKFREPK